MVSGQRMEIACTVPAGRVHPARMLPVFQKLTNSLVDVAVSKVEKEGKTITCNKGCGACCRQLVPLAWSEAHQLRRLINDLPEPRRAEVRARFAAARQRLAEAGLLEILLRPESLSEAERKELGLRYFSLGIACPFLADESCSIHSDRPLSCREYLVTSPAAHCASPTPETVECVPLPGRVSSAVRRLSALPWPEAANWVPLILAPEQAAAHPDTTLHRTGPEFLRDVLGWLSRAE